VKSQKHERLPGRSMNPFFLSGFVLALAWRQMDTASSFSGFCVGISDDKALLDRD